MRLSRILLIVLLLVGGFWFVTTHFSPDFSWSIALLIGADGSEFAARAD